MVYLCREYYSAIKRNEVLVYASINMDEPCKYYAKWKKPVTKDYMLYDCVSIKFIHISRGCLGVGILGGDE